jgi:tetratricopeptide (TPR) repeat protein
MPKEEDEMRVFNFAMVMLAALVACSGLAGAMPAKSEEAPSFKGEDIRDQLVDLDAIVAGHPDLVILYFFTVDSGEDVALKLRTLDMKYGRDSVKSIAVGYQEDEAELKEFADELKINYFVLEDTPEVHACDLYGPFKSMPMTFLVTHNKTVLQIIEGSGKTELRVLTEVAKAFLQQRKLEKANDVADVALASGEPAEDARETRGYALALDGRLDEAEVEFASVGSSAGLARVALERGDTAEALRIADTATDRNGYLQSVRGTALLREGRQDEAASAFEIAMKMDADDWQLSETVNALGRIAHERGDAEAALNQYRRSVALDPYNTYAMANEGSLYREEGRLEDALAVLQQAQSARSDEFVSLMLDQVSRQLKNANDLQRQELIRSRIKDLRAAREKQKAEGTGPFDSWSSRKNVVAFLPTQNVTPVFFERAGTDTLLRREIEARLMSDEHVQVVEREMLDALLQEMELGSSDLAHKDQQIELGKILAASHLGFVEFGQYGPDLLMNVRLVDVETTGMALNLSRNLKGSRALSEVVGSVTADVVKGLVDDAELKGLIADASDEEAVIINLGKLHGVRVGQRFTALKPGEPIEVGGRIIERPQKVAVLEVTEAEDDYAICSVVKKREGVTLEKETHIKAAGR